MGDRTTPALTRAEVKQPTRSSSLVARALTALPDRLGALLLWITLGASVVALTGSFSKRLVLPALLITVLATWRLMPRAFDVNPRNTMSALAATAVSGSGRWCSCLTHPTT